MTDKDLAKLIKVNQNTITNWKKSRPELIRLIHLGLNADTQYKSFLNLFDGLIENNIFNENDFFVHFYLKVLDYFRQNITNPKVQLFRKGNKDFISTFFYFLLENDMKSIFHGYEFRVTEFDVQKFSRKSMQKPLIGVDYALSQYILKNTIDNWETFVRDIAFKSGDLNRLRNAIELSFFSILYKIHSHLSYNDKVRFVSELLSQLSFEKSDTNLLFKQYITLADRSLSDNLDAIIDLNGHINNDFHIPSFVERLKLTGR